MGNHDFPGQLRAWDGGEEEEKSDLGSHASSTESDEDTNQVNESFHLIHGTSSIEWRSPFKNGAKDGRSITVNFSNTQSNNPSIKYFMRSLPSSTLPHSLTTKVSTNGVAGDEPNQHGSTSLAPRASHTDRVSKSAMTNSENQIKQGVSARKRGPHRSKL